jgi:hypothetical protein
MLKYIPDHLFNIVLLIQNPKCLFFLHLNATNLTILPGKLDLMKIWNVSLWENITCNHIAHNKSPHGSIL